VFNGVAQAEKRASSGAALPPQPLSWDLSSGPMQSIQKSKSNFAAFTKTCDSVVLDFKHYGKKWITSNKLSPDGVVQMAIQLAYYKQNRAPASTYEASMTKQYYYGRTETLRSCTNDSLAFTKAWTHPKSSKEEKIASLRKAIDTHVFLANENKSGRGVDRHLYGMYHLARQMQMRLPGYHLPKIYTDKSYSTCMSNVLSTSNCGTDALGLFGFGAVTQNGYGIGYFVKDRNIPFNITSFERPTAQFVSLLEESLWDIKKEFESK